MGASEPVRHGTAALDRYREARRGFHRFRRETDVAHRTALALGFAALTGIAAQVRVPLPFTPVPITMQTAAVLLCGIALGARFGGVSQALYVAIGAAGVPWFQGGNAGLAYLAGPTGGYVIGFVGAAVLVGWAVARVPWASSLPGLVVVLLAANFAVIHGLGLVGLGLWLTIAQGAQPTAMELLAMGSLPFVPGDLVKIAGAIAIGRAIAPQREDAASV